MARLTSIPPFTGTVGRVTIYKMFGGYFIRSRSSLTANRVKTDPAFRKFLQYANLMAIASVTASAVYARVLPHRKKHALYRKITGEAMTWLKYRWKSEEIIEYLSQKYAGLQAPVADGAHTRLRPAYRVRVASRPQTANRSSSKLRKNIPFSLREWRQRDALYRRQHNQTFNEYSWSEGLLSPPS